MKKAKSSIRFGATFSIFLLSGCGIYNNEFECKPGKGVGCVSSWEVSDMILEKQQKEPQPFDETEYVFDPSHPNKGKEK